ncbi:hypothetical protein L484_009589 [Morus notabilis]|uniref:Uncharacterized protein n=1 Tax=Morus notabilis TaxID=981085 RepID=W9QBT1_9ROSA|nr:hypothetical protein L484_009589 [Morus notabilis]
MGKLWRNNKSTLTRIINELAKSPDVDKVLARRKPTDVKSDEWEEFYKIRTSKEFKEKSEKMRKVRAKLTYPHTTSRKGYARLEKELAVEEDSQSEDDEESLLITEDPITRALCPERPGCVRGRGFGVTFKTLEA